MVVGSSATLPALVALVAVSACAACSGGKRKAVEDARHPMPAGDAGVGSGGAMAPTAPTTPLGPYRVDTATKTGDVQIRVEWKDVPAALRASPGATPCGSPARPAVAPTTTWGIPEALVSIEVDHGKALAPARPRVALESCELSPRLAIAGTTLAIASAVEQPQSVTLAEVGHIPLGSPPTAGTPHTLYLPIVGHEVEAALTPGSVYAVTFGASETATIVAATTPYVAITEPTGQVIVRDVPVGTHSVRAWLPKRGALESRTATGTVTVTEGALAEITLDISVP
jgi:hypothetical protein